MRITVNEQGQLSLPSIILERLNWATGSEVEVEVVDDQVILKPITDTSPLAMEGSVLVYCGKALEDTDMLQQVREDRLQSFWPA